MMIALFAQIGEDEPSSW